MHCWINVATEHKKAQLGAPGGAAGPNEEQRINYSAGWICASSNLVKAADQVS